MTTNPYASRSLDPKEPMTELTPVVIVPRSRAVEWMNGTRPLDGMDANDYFQAEVATGSISPDRALELHQRHLRLTRQEAAVAAGALLCKTCNGEPPPGFACRNCGAEA
jgi:hypothetical protein